jgi:probable O-glycosylation ligase (exosortase A-associated)
LLNTGRKLATAVDPEVAPRYLYWWLLLAIFFEYARPGSFVPGITALKLNSLIPLSLLVFCVFARSLRPVEQILKDPLTKWLLIYFAVIALSMAHGIVSLYAIEKSKQVLGYVFLFFIIVRIVTSNERLIGIFTTLLVAHLFLLLMNPAIVLNPEQRVYIDGATFLGDGNDFGLSLCILLPMAVALAINVQSKWRRLLCWCTVVLLLLATIGTSSRGATLGLIAVAGYLWLISPRKVLTLSGLAVAVVIVLAFAPDSYFQRMNTIAAYEEDGSAMGRIDAWKASLRMAADHPLLGVGAGHFPLAIASSSYRPPDSDIARWITAHSMYFLVLGELGLPGIMALLMLVFGNMRASSLLHRHLLATTAMPDESRRGESARLLYLLNASMVGLAVAGAFLSVSYYPHLFVLTGLMVSCRCIARGLVSEDATVTHKLEKPLVTVHTPQPSNECKR